MGNLSKMRAFLNGNINESALLQNDLDNEALNLDDQEIMDECMSIAMPIIIESLVNEDAAEALLEATTTAWNNLQGYLVGQGLMNESAFAITNPKINFVRLNKQSQINRLTKIVMLKLARKANDKDYKRFKFGHAIKKKSVENMMKRYGTKAERLAKQLYAASLKHSKVTAVVNDAKKNLPGKK